MERLRRMYDAFFHHYRAFIHIRLWAFVLSVLAFADLY
jgi:hypothetical protein